MSAVNKLTTSAIWLLRILEFIFAVILLGTLGFLARETKDTDVNPGRAIIVPLVISAIAIVTTLLYFTTFIFKAMPFFLLFAFLDFCIFVIYLTSAGLYRKNFNGPGLDNPMAPYIINARRRAGKNGHSGRIQNLVKLIAGLIIMEIIFFFFTMLMTAYRAWRSRKSAAVEGDRNEKMGFNRLRNDSGENAAVNGNSGMMAPGVGNQHNQQVLNAPVTGGAAQTSTGNAGYTQTAGDQYVTQPAGVYRQTETERVTSTTQQGATRGEYV